jgi:hypothetical protein
MKSVVCRRIRGRRSPSAHHVVDTDVDLVAEEAANVVRTLARSAVEDGSARAGAPQQTVY